MWKNQVIACDMTALSVSERTEHHKLLSAVTKSIRAQDELSDGYRFALDPAVSIVDVASWIALETRCCPFLRLELEVGPGARVSVNLRGPDGVKGFIAAELGLSGSAG